MKNILKITLSVFMIIALTMLNAESSGRGEPVQSFVDKGAYVPGEIVTPQNMRFLPIPSSAVDYTFYQSIHRVSNIVIGKFKVGEKEIVLIQDYNNDGQVDLVAHWVIELDRIDREGEPDKYCTAENFKKLKEAIVNGKNESIVLGAQNYTISPNREGIPELERIVKIPSNVSKYKQGARVKKLDADELSKEILAFSFSFNSQSATADMAFDIKYNYMGKNRISPIINHGVYCLNSEDPFAIEIAKKLIDMTLKYLPK